MIPPSLKSKLPSAGPSKHSIESTTERVKSPRVLNHHRQTSVTESESEDSDEFGASKKKKNIVPGEYDASQYDTLDVNEDIKEQFQYIIK